MKYSIIKIKTRNESYNVFTGNNLISNLTKILKSSSISFDKCLLVIDNKVPKKFVKKINLLLKKKINFNIILIQVKLIKIKKQ